MRRGWTRRKSRYAHNLPSFTSFTSLTSFTSGFMSDGILLLDKPAGPTAHDVVAAARPALGLQRIGHAGTLDPAATGLLVVLVGRATRLARFVSLMPKRYSGVIRFGMETDTDDAAGAQVGEADESWRPLLQPEL